MKLPKKQQNSFTAKTQKDVSKEWKISSLLKDAGRDNSLDPSPVSLSGSPSSIEVMPTLLQFSERESLKTLTLFLCNPAKMPSAAYHCPQNEN